MKKICYLLFLYLTLLGIAPTATAADAVDSEGYPELYIRGTMTNSWAVQDSYKMTRNGSHYTISLSSLNGSFKIGGTEWIANLGNKGAEREVSSAETFLVTNDGGNLIAVNLTNVRIDVDVTLNSDRTLADTYIQISANGVEAPAVPGNDGNDDNPTTGSQPSGTLPVLYINVYDANGNLNNEVISANLDHKNYFSGEYWLDVNGCQWLIDEGAVNVGSQEEPLPLEIKARGNYTRKAFAKKPFKLKLGAKQSLLGMSKSKHYAILAHADDNYGYLRNFTGFNLGRRIGLPWTPWQQPVEVVINGDYRGLYFLTESIRIEKDRVNITELDDNVETPELISGGYIVELDNYDEDNQIRMDEKTSVSGHNIDALRITWDTPEEYSEIQKRFVTDQFSAMNDAIGSNSDDVWKYMDLDDAARYYIVTEIISHVEAYHGSTYLFRDHGEGQKWHFSPLWDCGNGFNGSTNQFFYDNDPYGNTWIPSMRNNQTFNNKVFATWKWFMQKKFPGLYDDIDSYVAHISEAAKSDRARWKDAPRPTNETSTQDVVDNSDMQSRRNATVTHLQSKIAWLEQQWGSYSNGNFTEPERDTTEAAPLPSYTQHVDPVTIYFIDDAATPWTSTVHAYIYDENGGTNTEHLGKWPGRAMTSTEVFGQSGWSLTFTPTYPGLSENAKMIFNNGNYGDGNQIADVTIVNNTVYYRSGKVANIDDTPITGSQPSGTLPVLYINVYDANGNLDNEVISANLDHKNYFSGEYWLDVNGCQWLIDEGAVNVGSQESPLPLEIKARGNYTRKAFAKKPFKLKLGAKQSLLGMSKSKHYAILAHADDNYGYLRNFTGFNLGRRIGLPWTPWQQPVEVVINGDYRGLYFLTESIRIEKDRVNITELDDNVETPELISGGYIVELDNYDEDNQIRMDEKTSVSGHIIDKLRVTWDTPEEYSEIQKQFITDQFSAMNDAIGSNSDDVWKYMDLDDAARYYIVTEIISHVEAYHGSTYLFRDHGEGQKWHFSPLWDCGNGFNGSTNQFFYDNDPYGNTWIPSMRNNQTFNNKVFATWKWFMQRKFSGLYDDIDSYVAHISEAAKFDRARWKDAPRPTNETSTQDVVDNSDMQSRRNATVTHLQSKIAWLEQQWGSYNNGNFTEPERDTTEAAPLPPYTQHIDPVTIYFIDDSDNPWTTTVHAYIWDMNGDNNTEHLGAWPGRAMTPADVFGHEGWSLTFTPYLGLSENAWLIFNNGSGGEGNQMADVAIIDNTIYYRSGNVVGIENIESDSTSQNAEYFDLQGISINAPISGQLYIVRRGTTVTKEIYR